jgi:hypothetical protein
MYCDLRTVLVAGAVFNLRYMYESYDFTVSMPSSIVIMTPCTMTSFASTIDPVLRRYIIIQNMALLCEWLGDGVREWDGGGWDGDLRAVLVAWGSFACTVQYIAQVWVRCGYLLNIIFTHQFARWGAPTRR